MDEHTNNTNGGSGDQNLTTGSDKESVRIWQGSGARRRRKGYVIEVPAEDGASFGGQDADPYPYIFKKNDSDPAADPAGGAGYTGASGTAGTAGGAGYDGTSGAAGTASGAGAVYGTGTAGSAGSAGSTGTTGISDDSVPVTSIGSGMVSAGTGIFPDTGNAASDEDLSRKEEWESLKAGQDYESDEEPGSPADKVQDESEDNLEKDRRKDRKSAKDKSNQKAGKKKGLFGWRGRSGQDQSELKEDTVLGSDNTSKTVRQEYWRRHMMDGTDPDTLPRRMKRAWDAHYRKIMLTAVFLVIAVVGGYLFNRFRTFHSYDVKWQVASSSEGVSEYITFGNVILNYSEDGISCINSDGTVLWNEAFNMDAPTVAVKGDYAIVYDLQGTDFYICTAERCTGRASSSRTILNADISASGVAALVLDDTSSIFIDYYDKSGNKLEIEVKASISGENGYPIDIAVSPGGTQLLGSFAYQNGAELYNQVVFRNFDAGKNNANRVVAAFRDYELDMVPEVIFFDDEWSAALRSDGIDFYSTANELKPERKNQVNIGKKIKTVFYSEDYIGIVLDPGKEAEEGSKDAASDETEAAEAGVQEDETAGAQNQQILYEMIIYDKKGNEHSKAEIDFEYTNVELSGDGIVVFNDSACAVYNLNGVRKFESVLDIGGKHNAIKGALRLNEKNLVIYGNGALVSISLK